MTSILSSGRAGKPWILGAGLLLWAMAWPCRGGDLLAGWGVDGCIAVHAGQSDWDKYVDLLHETPIRYVRDRGPGNLADPLDARAGPLAFFRKMEGRGLRVVAFVGLVDPPAPRQEWDQLPEDLLGVYRAARKMSFLAGDAVSVWEMVGEPDTHFCKDLPDRVVAFQKAVYLGIRDGALLDGHRPAPGILMGGLGNAPGPWLERAARNGLYEYTDGVNFHFYGHASDLRGMIRAQRKIAERHASRALPLWITECGMDALPAGKPDDPAGREIQRDFTVRTARIAREEGVGVFMPFILVSREPGGHSLLTPEGKPYPAWTAYADFIREHSLPPEPVLAPPSEPSREVLQWLPDYRTCIPHKVSGSDWFLESDEEEGRLLPIEGEIAVYNFSESAAEGVLVIKASRGVRLGGSVKNHIEKSVALPAYGRVSIPLRFEAVEGFGGKSFVTATLRRKNESAGSLAFGLERRPDESWLTRRFPLRGRRPEGNAFQWIWAPEPYAFASAAGPWIGVNGVEASGPESGEKTGSLGHAWRFAFREAQTDTRRPPMAITKVKGLPAVPNGFLRLRVSSESSVATRVRVDLVDDKGQRFAVAENLGQNWFDPTPRETYLSYRDFNLYAWGRCTPSPDFHPEDVREIQLRFYPGPRLEPLSVQLDVVAPSEGNDS